MKKLNCKLFKFDEKKHLNFYSIGLSKGILLNSNFNNTNIRYYSTATKVSEPLVITPWFITGFADGEASFVLGLQERSEFSAGWQATAYFTITLHSREKFLLEAIQSYFGGIGNIKKGAKNSVIYTVSSIKEIDAIITHFNNYCLLTQKKVDFELFKCGVEIIKSGRHRSTPSFFFLLKKKRDLKNSFWKEFFFRVIEK